MGYTTTFKGKFTLDKSLAPEHAAYLAAFRKTRRMKRDPQKAEALPDPVRIAAGLPIGDDAGYFVGGVGFCGQGNDPSVVDHNVAPGHPTWEQMSKAGGYGKAPNEPWAQPGLWCQWQPTQDGSGIEWDGGEKFYHYADWLRYLIKHFLAPWGYKLSGAVRWQGEDDDDRGWLMAHENKVHAQSMKAAKPPKVDWSAVESV